LWLRAFPATSFSLKASFRKKKGRQTRLKYLAAMKETMVFYESPFRLLKTLDQFSEYFGCERKATVARELTKFYEEIARGTISELILHFGQKNIKGEIVIVVEGKKDDE
jgi:16S rRNA (cytidine1402-2'-O)-methyltransferase